MLLITKVLFLMILQYFLMGITLLGGVRPAQAAMIRNYTFVLENKEYSRVCEKKSILTINGKFPGPTLYARRGDLVIVDVYNRAAHNITIHWHGVKMPRYLWSDGPEYVTQCPISPDTKFTQRIVLSDEEGTLWWHAHSEWSRATVHGALIILPPKKKPYPFPKPRKEVPIILGEWWKSDVQQVMEEFLANGGDPNVSDAFLINGQPGDLYNCSRRDTFKLKVDFGKTYLLRMINAVMNNIMFFKIANHSITVVGSDGAYNVLNTSTSDYIAISPGQTIDFLLEANQPPSHYYMAARPYDNNGGMSETTTTTGIIEYRGIYTPPPSPFLPTLPAVNDTAASFNFTKQLISSANPVDVPLNITDEFFFTLSINTRPCPNNSCNTPSGERLLASVNNITMLLPRISVLEAYYKGINGVYDTDFPDNPPFPFNYTANNIAVELWRPENGTKAKVLEYNSTVEIVFQGTNTVQGVDHPMHLHGQSFYVVGSGLGNFDKDNDPQHYNLVNPPLMQTIAVPVRGWTTIRFRANNPGVWFMHCHFERHVSWGMGMTFIVKNGKGPNASMLPPPPDMPRC